MSLRGLSKIFGSDDLNYLPFEYRVEGDQLNYEPVLVFF